MQISVETQAMFDAAKNMETKGAEIESAIQVVDSAIGNLRDMKSDRLERGITNWDSLKTTFKSTLEELLAAAKELAAAAQANEDANK